MFHGFIRGLDKFLVAVFSKTKVYGRENIQNGNVVYVCNHMSIPDAFINYAVLPPKTHFMAKKEWFNNKIVGWTMRKMQVFPIDRGKVDLKSIRHACDILEQGNNLCIYPQGTRCERPEIEIGQMHKGVGMIALKGNSTVIPLMFNDKPAFFKKNVLFVGKPIDMSEFDGKWTGSDIQTRFTEKLAREMNALLEEKRKLIK